MSNDEVFHDVTSPRGNFDSPTEEIDSPFVLRRSKRRLKPKSLDDSDIYVSSACVKLRHNSREQIKKGNVNNIAADFEHGKSVTRSRIRQTTLDSIAKRSESCPRLSSRTHDNTVIIDNTKSDRRTTIEREKIKERRGDGKAASKLQNQHQQSSQLLRDSLTNSVKMSLSNTQSGKKVINKEVTDKRDNDTVDSAGKVSKDPKIAISDDSSDKVNNANSQLKPNDKSYCPEQGKGVYNCRSEEADQSKEGGEIENTPRILTSQKMTNIEKTKAMESEQPKVVTMLDLYSMISELKTSFSSTDGVIRTMQGDISANKTQLDAKVETLGTEVKNIAERLTAIEEEKSSTDSTQVRRNTNDIKAVENSIDNLDVNTNIIMEELQECKSKVNILSQIVNNQATKIEELTELTTDLQARSMKYNIVITGILRKKDEDCKKKVERFLTKVLKVTEHVDIIVAHRLGKAMTSPIVARIGNDIQKKAIFQNVSNLQGRKNSNGDFFRVNDQLPGMRQEKDRRRRDIIRDNNRANPSERLELTTKGGQIYITEGETVRPYDSLLICPAAVDALEMTQVQIAENACKLDRMGKSGEYTCEGSTFLGFSREIKSIDEVNEWYRVVRMAHSGARHIVCAFRLPGMYKAQCNDFCDDEEWGGGRILLNALKFHDIEFRCIFGVRYYAGAQIGPRRFMYYLLSTRDAINNSMLNSIVNKAQIPWTEDYARFYMPNEHGNQVIRRGRGRGYRRGGRGGRGGHGRSQGRGGHSTWADREYDTGEASQDTTDVSFDEDGFPDA